MKIEKIISDSIDVKKILLQKEYLNQIGKIGKKIVKALKEKNKILVAGNGGSAADSQHFVAELVNRFQTDRRALPAISLTTDSSVMTSIGNDSSFDEIFSRQIEALGNKGDVFFGITTSGNSVNIIRAVKTARKRGLTAICLLGRNGGKVKNLCDYSLVVPVQKTSRIQESHILVIHIICEMIDEAYAG